MARADRTPLGILPIVDLAFVEAAQAVGLSLGLGRTGVQAIELRMKEGTDRDRLELARAVGTALKPLGVRLIVNDRPDIAVLAGADGVHLGQTDLDAASVRRWLPPSMIIGVSCHTPEQARAAYAETAADYIGYGPIFATSSKARPDPVVGLEGLASVAGAFPDLAVIAIGGITVERLEAVRRAGASGAAMISGILGAPDPLAAAADAVQRWSR